ncbi:thioredoxin [Heterostelium album PN500]|uniref:Thioredoxin n=1 Tax=Heterostelium pallidum (strain ATCC 26659 / Pp 5 / PN500) TaxID=670386 RepID=D3AYP2_HETP5|nr:thioredoxin [Heterostelium album PN500]EFA86069.1 thioredoxin [Heterostelium album PN500]|eukprot:XP_020438175.1 thioredoxin [Heterostelium album PN500]
MIRNRNSDSNIKMKTSQGNITIPDTKTTTTVDHECCMIGGGTSNYSSEPITDLHKDANCIEDLDRLLQSSDKVILFISAKWCSPCRILSPIFGALSEDTSYKDILFIKTDADLNPDHPIVKETPGVPSFITYYKQVELDRFSGRDHLELKRVLDRLSTKTQFIF